MTAGDENGDLLLYTMSGPDADSFDISRNNGQLMTKADLDFETKATYQVVVTAADPSGAADSILVTINVTDEDDPADIAGASSLSYAENGTGPVATFAATDQDGDAIEWSLSGDDADLFTIDGGVLAFKESPNYEEPSSAVTGGTIEERNAYNITIEATGGTHSVTVNVTNVDEAGSVSINKPQPQVGRGLEATLEDEDGGVSDETWQWARSEDGETWTDIEGATAQSRSPSGDDAGNFLRATVTYADSFGNGKMVSAVTTNRVEARTVANAAPSFADQDEDTTSPDTIEVSRKVAENAGKGSGVGKPVSATDADSDVLLYSLEDGNLTGTPPAHVNDDVATDADGTATPSSSDGDSRHFTIDPTTGQIKINVDNGLNYESPVAVTADSNTYNVRVIATDRRVR